MWKPQEARKAQNLTLKPASLELERRLVGVWGINLLSSLKNFGEICEKGSWSWGITRLLLLRNLGLLATSTCVPASFHSVLFISRRQGGILFFDFTLYLALRLGASVRKIFHLQRRNYESVAPPVPEIWSCVLLGSGLFLFKFIKIFSGINL
jgi:hypothetical protein